jgi:hypothetical protein
MGKDDQDKISTKSQDVEAVGMFPMVDIFWIRDPKNIISKEGFFGFLVKSRNCLKTCN